MMDEQLKAPFITQYSKDNWPIYKTMVFAYADVKILRPKQPGTTRKLISASNY
jgi:hypothetical protein